MHACVKVTVAGPIELVQAPPPQIAVGPDGVGKFSGKIRATQVAPGSAVPFDIMTTIRDCSPGAAQGLAERSPGPIGTPGGKNPGPAGDTEMKLSLLPGPVAVNPFVKQDQANISKAPATQTIARNAPPPAVTAGSEHTMDSTSKYAQAPPPMSICNFQTKTPVITAVQGVVQPTVFTQQAGLNYFTVHGCNFGSTPGHVYLVFHPDNGPGFPNPVELYRMSGNNVWTPDTISVYMNPEFGGHLDQTGLTLRVVTAKGLTAELPNQVFHAEREMTTIGWLPRSQVALGTASDPLVPVFQTAASGPNDTFPARGRSVSDPGTATVDRSISNVGGPFTVQDDVWTFSAMKPGFEVVYATPFYDNWNGAGCDQTSGQWGTSWNSATELHVQVQGCFHNGTGAFRSSTAHYGLTVQVRGPKGVYPWPEGLH